MLDILDIRAGRVGYVLLLDTRANYPGFSSILILGCSGTTSKLLHPYHGYIGRDLRYSTQIWGKHSQQYRGVEYHLGMTSAPCLAFGYVGYGDKHFIYVMGRLGTTSTTVPNKCMWTLQVPSVGYSLPDLPLEFRSLSRRLGLRCVTVELRQQAGSVTSSSWYDMRLLLQLRRFHLVQSWNTLQQYRNILSSTPRLVAVQF